MFGSFPQVTAAQFQNANNAPVQNGFLTVNPLSGHCPPPQQKKALEVVFGYFWQDKFVQIGNAGVQIAKGGAAMAQNTSPFAANRFDGLDDQDYELSLTTIDGSIWDPLQADVLPSGSEISTRDAAWQPRQQPPADGVWHPIEPGQGVDKLAHWSGHLPETIWQHQNNSQLAAVRQGRNVLAPNDRVFIPAVKPKSITARPGFRFILVRKNLMARFRLRLCAGMQALVGEPFVLEMPDVAPFTGTTGEGGLIDIQVPALAAAAKISFGNPVFSFAVKLESLLPIADDRGVQQRLRNLGFPYVSDTHPWAAGVIKRAEQSFGMVPTGVISDDLRRALFQLHDV